MTDTMTIIYAGSDKNRLILEIQKHSENVNIENNTLVLRKYVNIFITSLLHHLHMNNAVTKIVTTFYLSCKYSTSFLLLLNKLFKYRRGTGRFCASVGLYKCLQLVR